MEKKDEASYGKMLHYSMDGRHGTFVQLRVQLDKEVSHPEIEKSFEQTCKRFPYFMETFSDDNICLTTVPNHKKAVVHYESPNNVIDYKKNNGFFIRLSVHENLIVFSFFHGVTDGSGAWNFVRVLLCEYYKNLGETVTIPNDIFKIEDSPSDDEYIEPITKVTESTIPGGLNKDDESFQIPGKKTKNYQAFSFSVDQKQFMEYATSVGGSPNSVSTIAIAKAIKEVYPSAENDKISITIPINAKPFIGMEKTQCNCLSVSVINFEKEDLSTDEKSLNEIVRKKIKEDATPEKILSFLASIKRLFMYLSTMKNISEKKLICTKSTNNQTSTVSESYVGRISFGSIEPHILQINSFCQTPLPLFEINAINGRFYFSVSSEIEIKPLVVKLCENFKKLGFDCTDPVKVKLNTFTKTM